MRYVRDVLWQLFYMIPPKLRLLLKKVLQRDGHAKSLFSSLIAKRNAQGKERLDRVMLVLENDLAWLSAEEQKENVLEIGVGYVASSLIALSVQLGARVTGVDINRVMSPEATRCSVSAVPEQSALSLTIQYPNLKMDELVRIDSNKGLEQWMINKGIRYLAPLELGNYAKDHPEEYDLVYSRSVLEHIPPSRFRAFVAAIRRLSSDHSTSIHFIDLTDHLSHREHPHLFANDKSYDAERDSGWRGNALSVTEILHCFDAYFSVVNFCVGEFLDDQAMTYRRRFERSTYVNEINFDAQWILIEARVNAA